MRRKMREIQETDFIMFDKVKCRACWKCVGACPEKVFGKINIIIHKHAIMKHGSRCIGCGKCVKACGHGAIVPVS